MTAWFDDAPEPSVTIRRPGPLTVTAADILARGPCGDWQTRIPQLCKQYRRERWSALDVLSIEEVPAQNRLWVVLHPDLLSEAVAIRWLCEIAADALRAAQVTDPRSWSGLEARLAYARGEIDAAARDAAWAAAGAAARAAAWAAARDAAWDAARDAARAAAWDAAWDAARAAARAAAWAAAWDAAWDAARAAAWDAARAAAWDAARAAAWAAARDAARAAARAAAGDAAGDAAWAAAGAAAGAAARADQIVTLRTLLVLEADGYDVLRGELGQPITARVA
jgi:hypothetical protein